MRYTRVYEAGTGAEGSLDCSQIVDVRYVDLNKDGTAEILVRGKTVPLCGGVGNCAFWIFRKKGDRYRVILEASDYVDRAEMGDQLLTSKTNGFTDILLRGHFSAGKTGFYYYKFDGRRYRDSKCLYEVNEYDLEQKIRWKFVTCEEFYRGLSN